MLTRFHSRAWFAPLFVVGALALLAGCCASSRAGGRVDHARLTAAIADPARTPAFVARDPARHPLEELTFFGVAPSMTVVELWPSGGYWTEILGPYLAAKGHYYVALQTMGDVADTAKWHERVAAQGARWGSIHETRLGAGEYEIAPAGSADMVLTFRNLHNWMHGGYAGQALAACFTALKPGGIFGIEEHRGHNDIPQDPLAKSGYVRQDYTIALAEKAGFKLVGQSEINSNPKDTKDWPGGVWTLPPTLSQKDVDREKYLAIGEADNFILKFQKPAN
jgi:predicted methyltransferase